MLTVSMATGKGASSSEYASLGQIRNSSSADPVPTMMTLTSQAQSTSDGIKIERMQLETPSSSLPLSSSSSSKERVLSPSASGNVSSIAGSPTSWPNMRASVPTSSSAPQMSFAEAKSMDKCWVCRQSATDVHLGIPSCEACKHYMSSNSDLAKNAPTPMVTSDSHPPTTTQTTSSDGKGEPMLSEPSPTSAKDSMSAATPMSNSLSGLPGSPSWSSTSNVNSDALTSSSDAQHIDAVTGKKSEDTCWVCGEKSNTFHYGILSCEGCKSFFARASSNHTSYNCPTKQCVINKETRNRCMYCRWKKCVAVGMSKTASKLGRRSKQLKAQIAKHNPKGTLMSSSSDSGLDSPICSPNEGSPHPTTPKNLASPTLSSYSEFSPSGSLATKSARSSVDSCRPVPSVPTPRSPNEAETQSRKRNNNDDDLMPLKSPMSHQSLQWQDLSSVPLPSPATAWFNVVEDPQMEKLTVDIHRMRLENFVFDCAHDPTRKSPPAIDISSVRQGCHIEVSELTTSLMESMLGCMTDIIRRVVCFCKKLPGFSELVMQDRTALIKNNMFEMVLVHSSHLVEPNEVFVVMGDPHILLSLNLLRMIPFSDTIVPLFRLNDRIQKLELSARETSLLCAMVILSPDGGDIENRDAILKLQANVVAALRREIRASMRFDPDETFMQLLMVLPMLREMNVSHRAMVSNFKMKMPGMFSDLHQEVFE